MTPLESPLVEPGWWLFTTRGGASVGKPRLVLAQFWVDARSEARIGLNWDQDVECVAGPEDKIIGPLIQLVVRREGARAAPAIGAGTLCRCSAEVDSLWRHAAWYALREQGLVIRATRPARRRRSR